MEPGLASNDVSLDTWSELLHAVRDEIAEAIENTVAFTRLMRSYDDVPTDAIQTLVSRQYNIVLDGLDQRRRPDANTDSSFFDASGETRGRQGVAIRDMLAVWRAGLDNLHKLARRVAAPGPDRDALLLEFLELALAWADFAMLHAAEGQRRGELSQAREHQHAQTNFVRRVLAGTATPARYEPRSLRSDSKHTASTTPSARAHNRRSTWRRSSATSAPTVSCDAVTACSP